MRTPLARWMVAAFLAVAVGIVPASVAVAAPGELDANFGDGGKVRTPIDNISLAYAIGRQASGKLIAAGCSAGSEPGSQAPQFTVARYTASGILDSSFGENGVTILSFPGNLGGACAEDLAIRPDDSIVLAGRALVSSGNNQDFAIAQLTPNGQLDGNFGTDGRLTLHPGNPEKYAGASAITLDSAGRAIVAGQALTDYGDSNKLDVPSFAAIRIRPDGTLDTGFGEDGEVIIGMHETNPEPGSESDAGSGVADVVRYADGRIGLIGTVYDYWPDAGNQNLGRVAIARLSSGGQLDPSFSDDGKLVTPVHSVTESALFNAAALTPDGRITVGGAINHQALVARFEQNGEPDLTFGSAGSTLLADLGGCCETAVQALHYQADGKLVVAGISDPPAEIHPRFGVARLDTHGEPDPSFGTAGVVSGPPFEMPNEVWGGSSGTAFAYDLALEPSGNIVVAGAASGLFGGGSTHFALARYTGDPASPSDRDGDGIPNNLDQCPDVPGVAPTGCPVVGPAPAPPASDPPHRSLEVRALGDSVTAAFGYYADGTRVPKSEILGEPILGQRCRPGRPPDGRCQSPDVVAYPAVWAQSIGVPIRFPAYANYAISGSTPDDWIGSRGQFRSKLGQVVAEDPDVILLSLGGNPLLTDFAFGLMGQTCMRTDLTGTQTEACLRNKLKKYDTVSKLTQIYVQLLGAPDATIGVFLYHKTYPKTVPHSKADILFSALNAAVATAFTKARNQQKGEATRLKLLKPPSFEAHQCDSPTPWVLTTDTCIHPNAAGQRAYASVITAHLFPSGLP